MGVPKFFRYISERYPCLSELAREQYMPEFDNLYLDMNGIIHNCSHPDDANIHFNITEEEMFKDIFNYIDKLFFLIRPQKVFFMAIDGVAPRAKMNQQRSRRFRSAKEAESLEKQAKIRGEVVEHERFDSNCITPGTEFMERLHEALCHFVKSKVSVDPLWQKCRVILSGHNCVGEGEHKIMEYIRDIKSDSNYNPNTRHCLYGLDADLIILGLCTHELHFVVLREEVKFGKKTKKASLEETRFFLLHLSLLREYLEMEFDELKQEDPNFNIANLIDDWVLMGFLVGNDFIPHLPCMHISSNALPLLYKTYKKVYSSLGGNINEGGQLNLERLEKYFAALAEVEFEIFEENHADLQYFEAKQIKNGIDEAFDFDVSEIDNKNVDDDMEALIESSRQLFEDDSEDLSDNDQHVEDEFENYKRNYYMNKLNIDNSNSQQVKELVTCYTTALQWILYYYYRGVHSWEWYYPFHYSPFISDLKDLQGIDIKFNIGQPFSPFQQLLAVLPAASRKLLPAAYQDLMVNPNSVLIDYYPENFEVDLNGKQHDWEAVVLLPFIDEVILVSAMAACSEKLTPSERKRDQIGPVLEYEYHSESEKVPGTCSIKLIHRTHSPEYNTFSELPNACRRLFFPGFPTMKHLKYKFEIKNARVKVFDYPSRNENLILQPECRKSFKDIYTVAERYLNQIVFIGWPHLIKAKVVGISSKEKYIDVDGIKKSDPKIFDVYVKTAKEHLHNRMGIEYADYTVMVFVKTYVGSSYTCGSQGKFNVNEIWKETTTVYPAQGIVSQIEVHNSLNSFKKIEELFPENSRIFFIGNPYYGSEGVVMDPMLVYKCGRLKVNITVLPEPDFSEAKYVQRQLETDYVNSYQAAAQVGLHVKILGRITGSVLVVKGARRPKSDLPDNLPKINIGLQFKYIKQQEELAGYARRNDKQWFLSSKAIALTNAYIERFPKVIEYLGKVSDRSDFLFEQDLFPEEVGGKKIDEIVAWLQEQDHIKAERVMCGSKTLEKESIEKVLDAIKKLKFLPVKTVKLQVKPHLLIKPDVSLPELYKPKRPITLFDRVVVVRNTYMVPLGSKGTVVGVFPVSDSNPVRLECLKTVYHFYEVLFDKNVPNGNDIYGIASQRVHRVPESSVLLIFTQENNRQNENIYDEKLYNQVDHKNISTKSWEENKEATNNSLSVSELMMQNKNNDIKMPQLMQKEDKNFWVPAINIKQKHTKQIEIIQNFNQDQNQNESNEFINETITATPVEPQQCNKSTQILKSILGLPVNQTKKMTEPVINANPQLPQPPPSWRTDVQIMPNNLARMPPPQHPYMSSNAPMTPIGGMAVPFSTFQQQISYHRQQQLDSIPNTVGFTYQNNQSLLDHELSIQQSQTLLQQRQPMTPQFQGKQICQQPHYQQFSHQHHLHQQQQQHLGMPQETMFSLNSSIQKGAFTPLQVARVNKMSNNIPSAFISSNNLNDTVVENLNQMSLYNRDGNNLNQEPDDKPTYGRKKPPRAPKIGARFDNAQ